MKPGKAWELIREITDKLIAILNLIIVYLSAGKKPNGRAEDTSLLSEELFLLT